MRSWLVVFVVAFVPMVAEAAYSRRNERALRSAGATEPEGDVYQLMLVGYPACFLAIVLEGLVRGGASATLVVTGLVIFAAAKGIKYWAIWSLGELWTFRVLVPRVPRLVTTGPYRFVRHPNYLGVIGEFVGAAVMAAAPVAGVLAVVGFGALMLTRIRLEERALGICAR